MICCAYYDREADSRGLFEKRKLAGCAPVRMGENEIRWDTWLGAFDVIRIVMTDFMEDSHSMKDMLQYLTEEVTGELIEAYPDIKFGSRINLRTVMSKIHSKTQRQFVIVLDEWDVVFRVWKNDQDGQTKYLDFLRDWLNDKNWFMPPETKMLRRLRSCWRKRITVLKTKHTTGKVHRRKIYLLLAGRGSGWASRAVRASFSDMPGETQGL